MKRVPYCLALAFTFNWLCLLQQSGQSGPAPSRNALSHQPLVCIDPGHPSEINSGKAVQNGTTEVHIAWLVALKLRAFLMARGLRVIMTKSQENQLVKNKDRALFAIETKATVMVRLHCDASSDKGFAIYYPDRQGTKYGVTGPSASIIRRSKDAADLMHAEMARSLKGWLKDGGVRGDSKTKIGAKQGALTGSIFSKVPVMTIEMVVLSNKNDAAFIKSQAGQQMMAHAIADGIERFMVNQ